MLKPGLIVSCQAEEGSPFNSEAFIAAFAKAAELGGAAAVRLCGLGNIRASRAAMGLPIIGITKGRFPDGSVLITPTPEDAAAAAAAGADVVALDATARRRPCGLTGAEMIKAVKSRLVVPVMADVSTFEEGLAAAAAGADYVGTTLSGYTPSTVREAGTGAPDLDLVKRLAASLPGRVIAEGRIWTPEQAGEALRLGAFAVVVGTAITRPVDIIKRFAGALRP
ncbi:MAG: putative N-acetylmannosamine-6-phosphate 2-epimerase [Elusimicrobiota bacterium]